MLTLSALARRTVGTLSQPHTSLRASHHALFGAKSKKNQPEEEPEPLDPRLITLLECQEITLPKALLNHLASINDLYEAFQERLKENPSDQDTAKELGGLTPVASGFSDLVSAATDLVHLKELMEDASSPQEKEELQKVQESYLQELSEVEARVKETLLPEDPDDNSSAVLELRAGTGGDEAALFARDLAEAYERYAADQRWKWKLESATKNELGGFREMVASVKGRGVFGRLKLEAGVHRVQRVPSTDSMGRIQTSTATVAVMPDNPGPAQVHIPPSSLRIDKFRAQGAGGQHVNKTDSAVRITHLPTNTVVVSQDQRSQHKNLASAMKTLTQRLKTAADAATREERKGMRQSMIGSASRSERVRTYNYPQSRITDHRIGLTLHVDIEETLARAPSSVLDELLDALTIDAQARALSSLEEAHGGDK